MRQKRPREFLAGQTYGPKLWCLADEADALFESLESDLTREKAWTQDLEAWRDEHAKHCPNQAAYDAEKERAERLKELLVEARVFVSMKRFPELSKRIQIELGELKP